MVKDIDVIKEVLAGNIDNFEQIIDKYSHKVFAIIARRIPYQDHNEVSQNIFIKCFRSLSNFDFNKPFENWMSRIALRSCADYWRAQTKKRFVDFSGVNGYEMWFDSIVSSTSLEEFESKVKSENTYEILQILLEKLNPDDRLMVELIYFEGYTIKEVALKLEWGESKVKVRVMRARKKMRLELENRWSK